MRLWARCGVVGLAVAASGSAGAQPATAKGVELTWDAPPGCPHANFLHDRIRAVVGDGVEPEHPVAAKITVQQVGGVWRLTLATRQGGVQGERAFEADTCIAVAEAAALVVAMMMDPDARLPMAEAEPAKPVAPKAPRAKREEPAVARPAPGPVPEAARVRVALSPSLLWDWGSLPAPTLGIGGVWSFRTARATIDFHGSWWPARRESVAGRSSSGVEVGLVAAGLQGCARVGRGAVELRGCVGGEIGSLSVDAFGVSRTQAAHPFWAGMTAGVIAAAPLGGSVDAWVQGGAVVPLMRPTMVVSPYGEVFRPGAIAGRAAAGLAYTF